MADSAETKTCPLCAERIKAEAKICPFCQHRQSRFPLLKNDLALLFAGVAVIASWAALAILASRIEHRSNPEFSSHREELTVRRTGIEFARQTPEVWSATNALYQARGAAPQLILDAKKIYFLDSHGNLLDVAESLPYGLVPQAVGPCYWITGFITNSGRHFWNVSALEFRLFDNETNLIEVEHPDFASKLPIAPHEERAFRVALNRLAATNIGEHYTVRVQKAEGPENDP